MGRAGKWTALAAAYGGIDLVSWQFSLLPSFTGNWVARHVQNPEPLQAWHVGLTGLGAVIMGAPTSLKGRIVGFPISSHRADPRTYTPSETDLVLRLSSLDSKGDSAEVRRDWMVPAPASALPGTDTGRSERWGTAIGEARTGRG